MIESAHEVSNVSSAKIATALAFDVGSKRIGVAVGNGFSGTARDLGIVEMREDVADWNSVDRFVREWRPDALVVGDPRTPGDDGRVSGLMQPSRQRAHRFAQEAAGRYRVPVWLVDERMSSIDAAARFAHDRAAGARKRSGARNLDAVAAAIILERWLGAPNDADRVDSSSGTDATTAVSHTSTSGENP